MSGIKDLLVVYDGTTAGQDALRVAWRLAEQRGAHLTAAFPYQPPRDYWGGNNWVPRALRQDFEEISRRMNHEVISEAQRKFGEDTQGFPRPDDLHWLPLTGDATVSVTKAARYYDLCIISSEGAKPEREHVLSPDVVALRSGKPVIVVPEKAAALPDAPKVVVAWDGRRAAARTLSAMLHILQSFTEVVILCVGHQKDRAQFWSEEVLTHVGRHGIKASAVYVSRHGSVAATIRRFTEDQGADLLVMGAYEHSKFSEDILGGTTHEILADLKTPVLMAH
ncbi:universal stress protein [Pseudochelatococcus sp. B33]